MGAAGVEWPTLVRTVAEAPQLLSPWAVLQVPLLASSEVTAAYDFHARQLRLVDAAIQQANWATKIGVDPTVMADYVAQDRKRTFNGKTAA